MTISTSISTSRPAPVEVLALKPDTDRPRPQPVPEAPTRVTTAVSRVSPATVVTVLTVLGLGIRLVIVRGFWLDEATTGYDVRLSYAGMIHQLLHDNHPPLDYTILWLVAHSLGSTETDLRLPSILFGTLTIPMLYLAGRALYHEWAGVLAAAFGTVGALAVWYSQEARMYALFILLATVTIWALARILTTGRRRYWLAWSAAGAAMIWTQWFAVLAVGTEAVIILWIFIAHRYGRRALVNLGVAVTSIAVVCAPGLPLLFTQFHNNQANGLGFGGHAAQSTVDGFSPYGILNNLVWALFGYHNNGVIYALVALWPLGLLLAFLLLGRTRNRSNRVLATIVAVPTALVFLASASAAAGRSLFEVRYFIEAVPALYLLLAGGLWTMVSRATVRRIIAGILILVLTAGLITQQTDDANPRLYGYNAAFNEISALARPGDEILYAPSYFNVDVAYFEPHMRAIAVTGSLPSLPTTGSIFVVGSFNFVGVDQAQAATARVVNELGRDRRLETTLSAPNVTVWEFS
jgi:uncharacterized membrane protein